MYIYVLRATSQFKPIMIKDIFISFALIVSQTILYGQNELFKSYKYDNTTSKLKFSLDIPNSWKEIPQNGSGYLISFLDTDSSGTAIKKLCLDSVIYKLKYFPTPISQAMRDMGFQARGNNMFLFELNNFINVVVGFEIKGQNYDGINCSFKTSLSCQSKKSRKKNDAEMNYLFFSNGAETICIVGNGIPLTERTLAQIESSFKFD
jgi:hypothetical protein